MRRCTFEPRTQADAPRIRSHAAVLARSESQAEQAIAAAHVCAGTGLAPAHVCAGTGLAP